MSELRVTHERGVARLTLSRPPLNVLTPALIDTLGAAFRELGADPALRVVVLEGAGRAFSAGVDVAAMRGLDTAGARMLIGALRTTVRALEEVPVPTLARLHGHVLGGALELVLACDLRVAATSCRLGMPEITRLLTEETQIFALDREVQDWVDRLLALPPDALRLQKSLLTRWRRVDLDTAVALSTDVFARAYATGEPSRAMQAFLDRRHAGSRPSGA